MTTRTRQPFILVLFVLALLASACGGTASPAPASGAPSTVTPTTEPSTEPTDAPGVTPPSGTDIDDAAAALDALSTYQLDITVAGIVPAASGASGITMTAIVDRENDAVDFTLAGFEGLATAGDSLRVILIGDDAWLDLGTGTFLPQPGGADSFGGMVESLTPAELLTSVPPDSFSGLIPVGQEERNGVATTHYRLDSSVPGFADSLGPDGEAEIWIAADGGYLVSMTMIGTTEVDGESVDVDMSFDISRVNDPTIDIQPPS